MAITYNTKTSGIDWLEPFPFVTASVTPTANTLQLLTVTSTRLTAATPFQGPNSITGCGLTWVLVRSQDFWPDASGSPTVNMNGNVSVFRALGASPSAGSITINYPSGSGDLDTITWSLVEFAGVDTTGTNGSGAIVQSAGAQTGPTWPASNLSISLAALGSASNATYGAFASTWNVTDTGATTPTAGSGYTTLHTNGNRTNFSITEFKAAGSTTVNVSYSPDSESIGGVAIEIKAAVTDTHVSLTGVAASGAIGSVAASHRAAITGLEAPTSVGTIAVPEVHGVEGIGQVGTLTPRIATNAQLTGTAATGGVGSLTVTIHHDITQVSAPAGLGSLVPHGSAQGVVTGVQGTMGLGVLSVQITHSPEPPPPPPRTNNNETAKPKKRLAQPDHALNWVLRTIGGSDNPLNDMVREYYPEIGEDVLSHTVTNIMTEMNTFIAMKRGILSKALIDAKEKQLVKFYALKAIQEHNADIVLDENTTYKPGLLS